MMAKLSISIFTFLAVVFLYFPTYTHAQTSIPVPTEFIDLYQELDTKLTSFESRIDTEWDGQTYPVVFASELANANANRGYALLNTNSLAGIDLTLDRLESLGIKGVKVAINYPILMPGIDTEGEFLAFYKNVATKVREHNMILLISLGHIVPGFSSLPVGGYADTFIEYKDGRRFMAHLIAQEIHPDYLTVAIEPTTEVFATGLSELELPEKQEEIVRYILSGMERGTPLRGTIKIGAGSGSWEDSNYVSAFSSIDQIDYIDVHIYPISTTITNDFLENVLTYTDIARLQNKKVIIGEAWLYKTRTSELALGAVNKNIFGRDPYSFWQPLDQKYMRMLVKMVKYKQLEFASVFWMQYLFAYLDYDVRTVALTNDQRFAEVAQNSAESIVSNRFSSTGLYYQSLISAVQLTCAEADLDCSGAVNLSDLSTLLARFGRSGTKNQGDVNSDGQVNLLDLSILLANFGN